MAMRRITDMPRLTPALMMRMDDIILDRISFSSVKELEEMYAG
jgi:hypothetical protein